MLWLFFLILILIISLSIVEYSAHDCIPKEGKECSHNCKVPEITESVEDYLDGVRKMVQNNYDFVSWRQSLLVALVVLFPIVYFIYQRLPDFYEFLIITTIIFVAIYVSSIWIWTHFFYPNGLSIEKSLLKLKDKITDNTKDDKTDLFDLSEFFSY